MSLEAPWTRDELLSRLRDVGASRYHDKHPFHLRMHEGKLSKRQVQGWVLNRYYYQTRIPIKDAVILSKSEDSAFRRAWIKRIHDHDGTPGGDGLEPRAQEGGLVQWLRLADGVGLSRDEVLNLSRVEAGTRFACDAYVSFVRERPLLEAVASSMTELFAPEIMADRIAAWETHYTWIDPAILDYFRARPPRARRDSTEALDFVTTHATTRAAQELCVAALVTKCQILWSLLDAVALAYPDEPSLAEPSRDGPSLREPAT